MKARLFRIPMALFALACAARALLAGDAALRDARLLRFPDIHGDRIVFSYAGDLWTVPAAGGVAARLTTDEGLELFPRFSPDGKRIAFTGHFEGSSDVYVVPAEGGIPRRLTWFPSRVNNERMGWDNMVIGWTPQGRILFRSQRGPLGGFVGEPYTVSPEGGPAERFPLPECGLLSFSPDGRRVAYNRIFRDFRTWKRYRGGMAQDVWIYDLESRAIEKITDWEGTDSQPMWIGNSIYFLSDREDWKVNIWRYDLAAKATARVTSFAEFDVKWPQDGPQGGAAKIVFENGGWIHVLDVATGKAERLTVTVPDDRKLARKRWIDASGWISDWNLAPGGQRAVFTARGDLFTVPAEHGNVRNISDTQGVREKNGVWSPDGRWIACISDASGEEELLLFPQDGKGSPVPVTSGSRSWHFPPVWSPDSKKIAWGERSMRLLYIDIQEKKPIEVDRSDIREISQYAWSPDSAWIAYAKPVENGNAAIFLYSLETRTATQATTGVESCGEPAFDPEGKSLYFFSDRDVNPVLGHLELSFTVNRMTRPYALVLRADLPSPFAPRSDEVKMDVAQEKKEKDAKEEKGAGEKPPPVRIDLDRIQERAVVFPVPAGDYRGLRAAQGKVLYIYTPPGDHAVHPRGSLRLFDLEKGKEMEILAGIDGYEISPDGGKLLYRSERAYGIAEVKEGLKAGDGKLDLSGLRMELDPQREWAQVFRDAWRIERDFFYLADMGQVDWEALRRRYEPLLEHVSHRYDLTYILGEMVGELATGHTYVGGGEQPSKERIPAGALGADLEIDPTTRLWRIRRILTGQNWIESRRSPLAEPGLNISPGDYLLAIDGKDLAATEDPCRSLIQKADRAVTLLVNSRPSKEGAREVTVRPIGSEADLRYHDWVEANRLKVDRATGGRAGYIHIPDMSLRGLQEFIRQYYPQIRKQGLIVDVRWNGGGFVSQMILERLRRVLAGMCAPRDARPTTYPAAVFNGPLVALLNQYSASDGDLFPNFFRKYGLGPLIGRRSWGGVVGIRGISGGLVDGGYINVPEFGHYGPDSRWWIENEGVEPDIVLDNLPGDELAGRDPQLERGIQEILQRIEERKPAFPPRPPSKDLRPPAPRKKRMEF